MTTKHGKLVIYGDELLPISHITLLSCGHVSSSDRLKNLNLHDHNAYPHQTFPGGDRPLAAPTHNSHDL